MWITASAPVVVVAHVVAREHVQSRARANEPTCIENVLQVDLVIHHTSPKECLHCLTIPFVLKASSHVVELVHRQLRLPDGWAGGCYAQNAGENNDDVGC
jgi:hypothetical protein